MPPTAKILIIDDEANIRASLKEMLIRDDHEVVTTESGEAALKLLETDTFDLALIDLKLGGIGGIEVLKALRERSPDTIAIVLTAHASLETAVEALRRGAHDYLFKPCKPTELRESIQRGLLNRQTPSKSRLLDQIESMASDLEAIRSTILEQESRPRPTLPHTITGKDPGRFLQYQGLIVDRLRHAITVDGYLLDLSPTEFNLLSYLVTQVPKVVSPKEIAREVQGYDSDQWEASEAIRQHVYRIRQKIKEAGCSRDVVNTVRGVGYTIAEQ
ncbi:MAG TPA: response regulator transcription factor [Chloroflexi bacterium]|nr:response regulator transcription factor [Chloroflexota bacterium]